MKLNQHLLVLAALTAVMSVCSTQAQVVVSGGYNDGPGSLSDFALPNPWYGSPNTTFYGNAATAQAFDPDENAILIQNIGGSPVVISKATMGSLNLFTLDSVGSAITIGAGQSVIFAGNDGSDNHPGSTVSVTIGGIVYNFQDSNNLLNGNPHWQVAESEPWGVLGSTAPVPEPSTYIAGAMLLLPFALQGLRKLRGTKQVA